MEVIVIESEAFFELIKEVVNKISPSEKQLNKWIDAQEAMDLLKVKKTTLQTLRDNGEIEFSKINKQTILYNRFSIEEFIENKKSTTF